jgi:hypothetical protein
MLRKRLRALLDEFYGGYQDWRSSGCSEGTGFNVDRASGSLQKWISSVCPEKPLPALLELCSGADHSAWDLVSLFRVESA